MKGRILFVSGMEYDHSMKRNRWTRIGTNLTWSRLTPHIFACLIEKHFASSQVTDALSQINAEPLKSSIGKLKKGMWENCIAWTEEKLRSNIPFSHNPTPAETCWDNGKAFFFFDLLVWRKISQNDSGDNMWCEMESPYSGGTPSWKHLGHWERPARELPVASNI